MKNFISSVLLFLLSVIPMAGADPMATDYTYDQCQGSLRPYPTDISRVACPDSLTPVMINHVGRHGARYPASASFTNTLRQALQSAVEQGTITPLGKRLLALTDYVAETCVGRWGALDTLGQQEQRMIASRMYETFKPVFKDANVSAISSYSPRCMMSMYAFMHQLDRLDNHNEYSTGSGRRFSPLMRPFDTESDYREFIASGEVSSVYDPYFKQACPTSAIERVVGRDYKFDNDESRRDLALCQYYFLAGLSAMSVDCDLSQYFTRQEINALWSCFNLRQYLQRTATTLSTVPADIASALLLDIISTTDDYIDKSSDISVCLRFGHAETLMPLLSLMHLRGCYYMTNYFDTVAKNWQDFNVVPMAANIQFILLKHNTNGKLYLRVDLNETPTPLLPNNDAIYVPWNEARRYLMRCLPLHMQI